jgi:large subunit ribosomal protein L5
MTATKTKSVQAKPARMMLMYKQTVAPALAKKYGYKNAFEIPRLLKIVVNMGVGEGVHNPKEVEEAALELGLITGQKPVIIQSKKSIANFQLRQGAPVGCKVTLRGKMMYEFFDRFVSISLPRVRDFRGISRDSFDGRGNYSIGIVDQVMFPEIDLDKVKRTQGMDITLVTSSKTDDEARSLLSEMGMPFRAKAKE